MKKERRQFLKSAAGITAGWAMACAPESETMAANAPLIESVELVEGAADVPMPTLQLGEHTVSRLIVGSNPIHGYSHFNRLYSRHMLEWSTPDHVCRMLDRCRESGINTWQFSHHERAMRDLKEHRSRGGQMQWILLSHSEIEEDHSLIDEVVKADRRHDHRDVSPLQRPGRRELAASQADLPGTAGTARSEGRNGLPPGVRRAMGSGRRCPAAEVGR